MRLHRGAELAVIVEVEPRRIAQTERRGRAGIRAVAAFADALHGDALGAEADGDRAEILRDVVDELAVGGQIENLLIEYPVVPDLRAQQEARTLRRGAGRHDRIEPADFLQRSGRGAHIFERGLGHDAALVHVPVVAEFGQRAVDLGIVAGAGDAEPGVTARLDFSETVDQRDGPGPWPLVDRGIEAELGEIERGRLQRQGNVDRGTALVDRKADIDARRNAVSYTHLT